MGDQHCPCDSIRTLAFSILVQFVGVLYSDCCISLDSGGDKHGGETGFVGCLRNLFIQGAQVTDVHPSAKIGNVMNGSCALEDRFVPFFIYLIVTILVFITNAQMRSSILL